MACTFPLPSCHIEMVTRNLLVALIVIVYQGVAAVYATLKCLAEREVATQLCTSTERPGITLEITFKSPLKPQSNAVYKRSVSLAWLLCVVLCLVCVG